MVGFRYVIANTLRKGDKQDDDDDNDDNNNNNNNNNRCQRDSRQKVLLSNRDLSEDCYYYYYYYYYYLFSPISFQVTAFWQVQISTRHQSDLPQHSKHVGEIIYEYACLAVDMRLGGNKCFLT